MVRSLHDRRGDRIATDTEQANIRPTKPTDNMSANYAAMRAEYNAGKHLRMSRVLESLASVGWLIIIPLQRIRRRLKRRNEPEGNRGRFIDAN